jgi:hypothetical protein
MDKMTNCKACGKEIAKGVNKCPHCGKDQRNFFMKHKIVTIIIALIILGGIGSAMGGKKDQGTKVAETTSANSKPATSDTKKEDSKKNETKTFKVGDVVQLKDFKITVNKVYNVEGNDMAAPKDGNEFVAVDCTVENISKEEQAVSSMMMFKVVDKDGRACEYSLTGQTAANAGQLDGKIGAGRKITGVYVVEVPKGTKGLELEFDGSLISSGQVVVNLN